jgi:NADPH2:quinone reductase
VAGELVRRLARGELEVAVQTYDLADTAKAIEDLRAGRVAGRAVVLP